MAMYPWKNFELPKHSHRSGDAICSSVGLSICDKRKIMSPVGRRYLSILSFWHIGSLFIVCSRSPPPGQSLWWLQQLTRLGALHIDTQLISPTKHLVCLRYCSRPRSELTPSQILILLYKTLCVLNLYYT